MGQHVCSVHNIATYDVIAVIDNSCMKGNETSSVEQWSNGNRQMAKS